jgi:hypothetical protein
LALVKKLSFGVVVGRLTNNLFSEPFAFVGVEREQSAWLTNKHDEIK